LKQKFVFAALVGAVTVCAVVAWWVINEIGVVKMMVPGEYRVHLERGYYTAWYFWRWPSKGLCGQRPSAPVVQILSADRVVVPPNSEIPAGTRSPQEYFGYEGWPESGYQIDRRGDYVIQSRARGVVVIAPMRNELYIFDNEAFFGIGDDLFFIHDRNGSGRQ
jgi:hypothetical protein